MSPVPDTEKPTPHEPVTGPFPVPEDVTIARVKALEAILAEKGLVSTEAIDGVIHYFEDVVGPRTGAKVVARAWVDPEFRKRLLQDASAACEEMGIGGLEGEEMVVLEQTDTDHHVIFCTLCSCYPWPTLGLPPYWFKNPAYRARMAKEPRKVLVEEFGLDLPDSTAVHAWDTSSQMRYWIMPKRPAGTEGMSEEELAELVTRDSMVGVAHANSPA